MSQDLAFVVKMTDQASAVLKQLGANFQNVSQITADVTIKLQGAGTALDNAASKAGSLGGVMGGLTAAVAAAGAAFEAFNGLAAVTKSFQDFQFGLAYVNTLLPQGSDHINAYSQEVQDLAVKTGLSSATLSAGLYHVISAFGDTADAAKIMGIEATSAVAGQTDLNTVNEMLAATTKAYGDTSAVAAQQTADMAQKAANLGNVTYPELAKEIGSVAAFSKNLGVSQAELFATFSAGAGDLGSAGQVMTDLRQIEESLLNPLPVMKQLFQQLGVESGKTLIAQKGLAESIRLVVAASESSGIPIGKFISGVQGQNGALLLGTTRFQFFKDAIDKVGDSAGSTSAAFTTMEDTSKQLGDRAAAAGDVIKVAMGAQLEGAINTAYTAMINLVNEFEALPQSSKDAIAIALDLGVALTGVAAAIGAISIAAPALGVALAGLASAAPVLAALAAAGAGVATGAGINALIDAWQKAHTPMAQYEQALKDIADIDKQMVGAKGMDLQALQNEKNYVQQLADTYAELIRQKGAAASTAIAGGIADGTTGGTDVTGGQITLGGNGTALKTHGSGASPFVPDNTTDDADGTKLFTPEVQAVLQRLKEQQKNVTQPNGYGAQLTRSLSEAKLTDPNTGDTLNTPAAQRQAQLIQQQVAALYGAQQKDKTTQADQQINVIGERGAAGVQDQSVAGKNLQAGRDDAQISETRRLALAKYDAELVVSQRAYDEQTALIGKGTAASDLYALAIQRNIDPTTESVALANARIEVMTRLNAVMEEGVRQQDLDTDLVRKQTANLSLPKQQQELQDALDKAQSDNDKNKLGPLSDDQTRSITDNQAANSALDLQKQKIGEVKQAAQDMGNAFEDAFKQAVFDGDDLKTVFGDLLKALAEIVAQAALFDPVKNYVTGQVGGPTGLLGSLFGLGGSSIPAGAQSAGESDAFVNLADGFKNGGAFDKGVQFYAQGDVFDSPTAFSKGGGNGLGVMGEAGPEAVMPLTRLSGGGLGVKAGGVGGGSVQNNIAINVTGASGDAASQTVLAKNIQQAVAKALDQSMSAWVRNQSRPGGMLSS